MKKIVLWVAAIIIAGALTASGQNQEKSSIPPLTEHSIPLLIEQRIVQIELKPEFADGIEWELLDLYLKDHESTTGFFPLAERARHRLDFLPMRRSVPPSQENNVDFDTVEQVRMQKFNFGEIWEDTRVPSKIPEDLRFGTLRIYQFRPVMEFLRRYGDTKIIFQRKWVTESGEQTMVSSLPEIETRDRRGTTATTTATADDLWDGSRITIKPEVIKNELINFHLDSLVATIFYVDPIRYPRYPRIKRGQEEVAMLREIFRLNTKGILESGSTAFFEDIREGRGVIIFITADVLETQRKLLKK